MCGYVWHDGFMNGTQQAEVMKAKNAYMLGKITYMEMINRIAKAVAK